ncbi:MAG: hypothetical protein HC859_05445 [Bacteroidia bacterium]|nr:hypothetical protein [Bacteroidia bacterium]
MEVKTLEGTGIDVLGLIFRKRVKIDEIIVGEPRIRKYHDASPSRSPGMGVQRQIAIGKIDIVNGLYISYDSAQKDSTVLRLSLKLDGLRNADSALGQWTFSTFATDSVFMRTPYYIVRTGTIEVDPAAGTFLLDSLSLRPHLDRASFPRKAT